MTCYLEFRWGDSVHQPSVEQMRQALAELDEIDPEHPDTWLTHGDTGWTLSAHEGGSLIWEKVEDVDSPPAPRHMNGVSRNRVLELWSKLAAGKVRPVAG